MIYYHLDQSAPTYAADLAELEAAFLAERPDHRLSVNEKHDGTRSIVKAPALENSLASEVERFETPPVALVTASEWTGVEAP